MEKKKKKESPLFCRNSLDVSLLYFPHFPLFRVCLLRHTTLDNLPFVMCQSALVSHWYLPGLGDNTLNQVFIASPHTYNVKVPTITSLSWNTNCKVHVAALLVRIKRATFGGCLLHLWLVMSLLCFAAGFQPLLLEPLLRFHHSLRRVALRDEEYVLMQAMSLFSPGSRKPSPVRPPSFANDSSTL